jgi:hypothetical protein
MSHDNTETERGKPDRGRERGRNALSSLRPSVSSDRSERRVVRDDVRPLAGRKSFRAAVLSHLDTALHGDFDRLVHGNERLVATASSRRHGVVEARAVVSGLPPSGRRSRDPRSSIQEAVMQRTLIVLGLLVAAAGFIAQMVAGVTDTPTIPPGLVAIVAAAALVAFTPWPSAPLAAVAAGVFNLGAFAVVGAVDRLIDTTPLLAFVGAWLMVLGLIVSSLTGTIAALNTNRGSGSRRVRPS